MALGVNWLIPKGMVSRATRQVAGPAIGWQPSVPKGQKGRMVHPHFVDVVSLISSALKITELIVKLVGVIRRRRKIG